MSPRRPPGESRALILQHAGRLFGERGYQGTTIRSVARAAEVDPSLVIQYFGSKDGLLDACLEFPFDPAAILADLAHSPDDPQLGTEMVRRVLTAWDAPEARDRILALLRTGLSHERAGQALSAMISRSVLAVIEQFSAGEHAALRAALAGSQMAGLAIGRMALHVPALAEASIDEIAVAVGPAITRYLTGDLDARP